MALPLVSADTWQAIKLASIRGVPDAKLAEYFNVTTNAISSRRYDDPDWRAAKPKLTRPIAEQTNKDKAEAISTVTNASLAEIGEQNSLLLAQYVAGKIKTSIRDDLLPEPGDWSQMKTANEILRKATGQDRDQAQVSVNLFSGGCSFDDVTPTFDVTVETQEADFC